MLRRSVPFVLIAAVLLAAGVWLRPRVAAWRHGRTVFGLARQHRDRMGPAWPEADAQRLWRSVLWFRRNHPEGLLRRILDGLSDADPVERESALVLASELSYYAAYPALSRSYAPSCFPFPRTRPAEGEVSSFDVHGLLETAPDLFASAVRGIGDRGQKSYLCLLGSRQRLLPCALRAVEEIAGGTGKADLRLHAISLVGRPPATPSMTGLLRRLSDDPDPRLRLSAAAALTRLSDPEGTASFVARISHPRAELPPDDLILAVAYLRSVHRSLEDAIGPSVAYFAGAWRPGDGLPCDLREPWETWLRLRESEGFAPEPQAERDRAWQEPEIIDRE